jgi:signal transduction histidine kinase
LLWFVVMASAPEDRSRKARFDALRRRIFAEMSQSSARMRLAWILPFNALVLVVLAVRGLPATRALVFGATLLVVFGMFLHQAVRTGPGPNLIKLMVGITTLSVTLAVTGGMASPLVPTTLPILVAGAIVLENARQKAAFFGLVVGVVAVLALLSRTAIGELPVPLTPVDGWPSAEYILLAAASLVFSAVTVSRFGTHFATAYERVAFELATRREEICSEGADRTRALEGMAARLAHEVKNPLAAIKGLSTHVARSSTDAKTAERLSIVAAEADRLQAIVDSFLSFSRGLDDLELAPTKPYEVARELSLLLETRAADAGVQLEVTGDADFAIEADPRKLRQALLNLVLNAMQASPSGEKVSVRVARPCPMDGRASIQVTDHGSGMTREVLDRIQKPYFTTREGGTGLGVAVARGLIEQHGGAIDYESAPGRGTTVTIRLPPCASSPIFEAKLPKVACAPSCARTLLGVADGAEKEAPAEGVPIKAGAAAKV